MTLRLIVGYLPSLTGFNFGPEDIKERPELTYHRMIEAFNFAAAKETYLTDPLFSDKTDQVKGQRIIWNQTVLILYFHIYHNARCLPSPPPKKKFCLTIVFDFSRDDCNTQEKLEKMVMQNLGG